MRERLTKDIQGLENFNPFSLQEISLPAQARAAVSKNSGMPGYSDKQIDNSRDEDTLAATGIGCCLTFAVGAFVTYESIIVGTAIAHHLPFDQILQLVKTSVGF